MPALPPYDSLKIVPRTRKRIEKAVAAAVEENAENIARVVHAAEDAARQLADDLSKVTDVAMRESLLKL